MAGSHRALRAVLHVVHGQLDLRLLTEVGVLEEGHTAQEVGVTSALRKETQRKHRPVMSTLNSHVNDTCHFSNQPPGYEHYFPVLYKGSPNHLPLPSRAICHPQPPQTHSRCLISSTPSLQITAPPLHTHLHFKPWPEDPTPLFMHRISWQADTVHSMSYSWLFN